MDRGTLTLRNKRRTLMIKIKKQMLLYCDADIVWNFVSYRTDRM